MEANSFRPVVGITCYVEDVVRGVWKSMPHALFPRTTWPRSTGWGTTTTHPSPGAHGSHAVRTVEGTRVSGLLGDQVAVPSSHHQSVASPPGYLPAAWAQDGTLEAMEHPDCHIGVVPPSETG